MTDFSSLAIDLLSVKVSDFHAGCLDNDFSFCSRHKFHVRGTIPNLRHTYHCYWCQETTSGVDFFLLVQAHIEAFFSAKTGIIYRSPDCYLAKAHKSDELVQDLQAAISSIDGDTATTQRSTPVAVLSGSQTHLAHYLWNHLSSLWRLLGAARPRVTGRLQLLVFPNSELFGPLDKILSSFPFIDYRTADDSYSPQTRKLRFHDKIILEPYENSFIPQALADSIISLSCSLYGNECITPSASFVYGARPYTRRPINRDKVFSSFLDAIYRLADSESRIVLDISSTLYSKGHDYYPPEDQIEELVHDLTEIGSKEFPSIDILPLVSCPVLKTICILSKSHFGVYEWGANLTWYSWLLRKPVIALAPPSVLQKLNDTHSSLQAWGSFFWESDSPIPLLPNTQLVPKVCDDGQLNTFRFAPDDYSVDIGSFCRLAEQAFLRDQR